jgi:hypothetical protein
MTIETSPVLETYIADNINDVKFWLESRWKISSNNSFIDNIEYENDWWTVKASKGNGGRDVWIINKSNYEVILKQISNTEQYVLQK